eukprot:GHRR01029079.1.p1 GENE.GHRR01029079.1~~GHRR01029079.1.p1  ORF type:complete len:159 (-),score=18.49 GHRR01029079.1:658-1134(-)
MRMSGCSAAHQAWSFCLVFCLFVRLLAVCDKQFVYFAGFTLNVLFLSWLYAYYCYDYKWSLQGKHLPARLSYFEANWAFFAGESGTTAECLLKTASVLEHAATHLAAHAHQCQQRESPAPESAREQARYLYSVICGWQLSGAYPAKQVLVPLEIVLLG